MLKFFRVISFSLSISLLGISFVHAEEEQEIIIPKEIPSWTNYPNCSLIPDKAKKKIKPFLLLNSHPLKASMDKLFKGKRPTMNSDSLSEAHFQTLFIQPRSFIRVVKHPSLPGHLLKIYLDTTLSLKRGYPDWHWFLKRCEGAKSIRECITKHKFKYFKVPNKYIYPLADYTFPQGIGSVQPKSVVLVVENMRLAPKSENKLAWKTLITKEHLNELYVIIKESNGGSYRADNIPYSRKGYFTFIDTEYPQKSPDFNNIKRFLSADMLKYWENLIANGGPKGKKEA